MQEGMPRHAAGLFFCPQKAMMDKSSGSAAMSDIEFRESYESQLFPAANFRHLDHVRLAWIYVRELGAEEAEQKMCTAIRRFAKANGADKKYHATITVAWVRMVAIALTESPGEGFAEFISAHGWLASHQALFQFYSMELIESEEARAKFMEPDLAPIAFPKPKGAAEAAPLAD